MRLWLENFSFIWIHKWKGHFSEEYDSNLELWSALMTNRHCVSLKVSHILRYWTSICEVISVVPLFSNLSWSILYKNRHYLNLFEHPCYHTQGKYPKYLQHCSDFLNRINKQQHLCVHIWLLNFWKEFAVELDPLSAFLA